MEYIDGKEERCSSSDDNGTTLINPSGMTLTLQTSQARVLQAVLGQHALYSPA
jgi:hypothetical protein